MLKIRLQPLLVSTTISCLARRIPVVNVSSSGYEPATYHSGNGTAYHIFLYTVQPGDQSSDLEYWDEGAFKTDGFVRRAADEVR